jgi:hypothetical protein
MNEQLKALVSHVATATHTSTQNIRVTFEMDGDTPCWSFTRVPTRTRTFSAGYGSSAEEAAEACIRLNSSTLV